MRIRIVLGDNHAMVREGLIALLQRVRGNLSRIVDR